MTGAENNPQPTNIDSISVLLDSVAVTAKTLSYIARAEELDVATWLPGLDQGIEVLRNEAQATMESCNELIKHIGGIPVRTSLELDAMIMGFTGYNEGVWTFKCRSPIERDEFTMSGSAERLREVYSATLTDDLK